MDKLKFNEQRFDDPETTRRLSELADNSERIIWALNSLPDESEVWKDLLKLMYRPRWNAAQTFQVLFDFIKWNYKPLSNRGAARLPWAICWSEPVRQFLMSFVPWLTKEDIAQLGKLYFDVHNIHY